MEQLRTPDRRRGRDRRAGHGAGYTGPERRTLIFRRTGYDRRKGWPPVCAYCGKVCNVGRNWCESADTVELTVESTVSICTACSKKRFPQFYSGR